MARGLTLIETLFTTAILVTGLVAVVSVFAFSTNANLQNRQRTAANTVLYDKMEQLRSTPLDNAAWSAGGSLKPESPANGYFDYVTITVKGTVISSAMDSSFPYIRLWQIAGLQPRSVTVVVYAQRSGLTRRRMELIRATTLMSPAF